jgi:hypothetical protein
MWVVRFFSYELYLRFLVNKMTWFWLRIHLYQSGLWEWTRAIFQS